MMTAIGYALVFLWAMLCAREHEKWSTGLVMTTVGAVVIGTAMAALGG